MNRKTLPQVLSILSIILFVSLSSCGKQKNIDQFIGNYDVFEECTVTLDWNYTIEIIESNSSEGDIIIKNFGDFSRDVFADVDESMISYDYEEEEFSISGTGEIDGNSLTLYYTSSDPSLTSTCIAYATKQ